MHKRSKRKNEDPFQSWGGYMNAKISKLEAQFSEEKSAFLDQNKKSNIFKGVSIFVNGYTEPSADELRCSMLAHGGVYHHYYRSNKTTHIIASSLPNAKFNQMKTLKIVKPEWITESIKAGKILNYNNYLLQNDFPQNLEGGIYNTSNEFLVEKDNLKTDLKIAKTAADEGYLKEFYSNSRLHYISTLASSLKQYIRKLRDQHDGKFPKRKILSIKYSEGESRLEQDFSDGNIIIHIDMDCFFVAVALRNHPHLKGQPVAVTHARSNVGSNRDNINKDFEVKFYKDKMKSKIKPKNDGLADSGHEEENEDESVDEWSKEVSSMSEIASCSYEARKLGVYKGMYLGAALKLCPNLKTVPYDFEGYKDVSMTLYNTIADYTLEIEAISCDELYADCTNLLSEIGMTPCKFAEILRLEIEEKTKCTASIGMGASKLLARLATKHAKPNGQFYLSADKVENFMKELSVQEIPGVGRTTAALLKNLNIKTCGDLQNFSLAALKKEFGAKTGEMLYNCCRGTDNKPVNFSHERKSVSAEINYGIRFNDNEEVETFLKQLSEEVCNRLKDAKMNGKNITLKAMIRTKDAPMETAKYLGHGACDSYSRSICLNIPTSDPTVVSKQVINLYYQFNVPASDLRGIGIQVSKLEKTLNKSLKTLHTYFPKCDSEKNEVIGNDPVQSEEQNLGALEEFPKNSSTLVKNDCPLEGEMGNDSKHAPVKIQLGGKTDDNDTGGCDFENVELAEETDRLLKLNYQELKAMIQKWITSESDPQPVDITLFKSCLKRLVEDKKLEKLCALIRCLHRFIVCERKGSILWQTTYDDIFDAVQKKMVTVFGRALTDGIF